MTQLTLTLGGFLGEDMALERLAALEAARTVGTKPLFCAALGLHLRHFSTPHCCEITVKGTCFRLDTTLYRRERTVRYPVTRALAGWLLLLFGGDDHHRLAAFHLRELFYGSQLRQIGLHPLEELHAD